MTQAQRQRGRSCAVLNNGGVPVADDGPAFAEPSRDCGCT